MQSSNCELYFDAIHTVPLAIVITSSGFRLVNNLLWKFDISSEKEIKMIKIQLFFMKNNKKNGTKVYVNIK